MSQTRTESNGFNKFAPQIDTKELYLKNYSYTDISIIFYLIM